MPPGGTWQCLETGLVVTLGGVVLPASRRRQSGMSLSSLQGTGRSRTKTSPGPKVDSSAPRQRAPRGNAPARGSPRPRSARSGARPPRGVQTRGTRQAASKPFPLVLKARATRRTLERKPRRKGRRLSSRSQRRHSPHSSLGLRSRVPLSLCAHTPVTIKMSAETKSARQWVP